MNYIEKHERRYTDAQLKTNGVLQFTREHFDDIAPFGIPHLSSVVERAQALFDKWLDSQPAVFTENPTADRSHQKWVLAEGGYILGHFTYTARLVNIQKNKAKECAHKPITYDLGEKLAYGLVLGDKNINTLFESKVSANKCRYCGIELVAEWKAK